jgi:hypothetical protein
MASPVPKTVIGKHPNRGNRTTAKNGSIVYPTGPGMRHRPLHTELAGSQGAGSERKREHTTLALQHSLSRAHTHTHSLSLGGGGGGSTEHSLLPPQVGAPSHPPSPSIAIHVLSMCSHHALPGFSPNKGARDPMWAPLRTLLRPFFCPEFHNRTRSGWELVFESNAREWTLPKALSIPRMCSRCII